MRIDRRETGYSRSEGGMTAANGGKSTALIPTIFCTITMGFNAPTLDQCASRKNSFRYRHGFYHITHKRFVQNLLYRTNSLGVLHFRIPICATLASLVFRFTPWSSRDKSRTNLSRLPVSPPTEVADRPIPIPTNLRPVNSNHRIADCDGPGYRCIQLAREVVRVIAAALILLSLFPPHPLPPSSRRLTTLGRRRTAR